jgi:hypothetical protein
VNLAYVITAHKSPNQLLRLLRAIYRPGNTYVLHVDAKADAPVHTAARQFNEAHANCSLIRSESIIWGSWRLARAQIRGMKEALRLSDDWSYCLNLTAQDYPLKTQEQIVQQLAAGPAGANYLEVLDFATASENPRKRLEYFWVPWRGKMKKLLRRRPPKFKVYWGSNYFTFTRAACEHLVSSDTSRRMQRYFRFALCADELIFQNALMHGPAALRDSIVSKTFRKLTWEGGSHPKTFTGGDFDELVSSDAWFARKFDEAVDATILDRLDEHVGGHLAPGMPGAILKG